MAERSQEICLSTSTSITTCLPMDLLATHILPRLPARSLVQYKCVSKAFRSLISSSQFIHLHSRFHPLSSASNRILLLLVTPHKAQGKGGHDLDRPHLYSLAFDEHEPKPPRALHNLPLPESLGKPLDKYYDHSIYVVGSCNGLVCLGFPGPHFMFLNPLTGMFTYETSLKRPGWHNCTSYGFGYDAKNDDYKVVRVTNYLPGREVSVYSLKSDSWKLIEAATDQRSYHACFRSGVLVHNRLLHWLFQYYNTLLHDMMTRQIVCFDVESEQWVAHVPLPYDLHSELTTDSQDATLGILDGCLSMTLNIINKDQTNVWIMKEYGVEESWTKLFSIAPRLPKQFKRPNNALAFSYWTSRTSKQVLLNLEWPQLGIEGCFWYDLERKTTNKFKINGVPSSFTALTMCLESLAPVFRGSHLSKLGI